MARTRCAAISRPREKGYTWCAAISRSRERGYTGLTESSSNSASTRDEIIAELRLSVGKHRCSVQRWEQLDLILRRRDDDLVADALLSFLEQQGERDYEAQEFVGSLLLHLRPRVDRQLGQFLGRLLHGWNRSVEEIPWYLALAFGEGTLLHELDRIDAEAKDEQILAKTRACRWWLKADPSRAIPQEKAEPGLAADASEGAAEV